MTQPLSPPEPDPADQRAQTGERVEDPDVPRVLPPDDPFPEVPVSARTVHNVHQQGRKIE
jgi:hypothetical protein